jgi:hypothetical protein
VASRPREGPLSFVYTSAKLLSKDEARRIAANIDRPLDRLGDCWANRVVVTEISSLPDAVLVPVFLTSNRRARFQELLRAR